jgi:hypothetical protein
MSSKRWAGMATASLSYVLMICMRLGLCTMTQSIQQNDGFNCGPIACLKVLELYGFIPTNSIAEIAQKKHGYRGVVMPFYERMLEVNEPQLKFTLGNDNRPENEDNQEDSYRG